MSRRRDNELYLELRGILQGKVKKPITQHHQKAMERVHARFLSRR